MDIFRQGASLFDITIQSSPLSPQTSISSAEIEFSSCQSPPGGEIVSSRCFHIPGQFDVCPSFEDLAGVQRTLRKDHLAPGRLQADQRRPFSSHRDLVNRQLSNPQDFSVDEPTASGIENTSSALPISIPNPNTRLRSRRGHTLQNPEYELDGDAVRDILGPSLGSESSPRPDTRTVDAAKRRRKHADKLCCPVPNCGSTFTRHFYLKSHLHTHAEKSFRCPWPGCNKRFSRQQDCKWHAQSHEKLTCDGCEIEFSRMKAFTFGHHVGSWCSAECVRQISGPSESISSSQDHNSNVVAPTSDNGNTDEKELIFSSCSSLSLPIPKSQPPYFIFQHLTDAILDTVSDGNLSVDEIVKLHKLKQVMTALDLVQSLVFGYEYRDQLISLVSSTPIDELTLREALLKDYEAISVILSTVVNSESDKETLLALRGNEAKKFVDLVETVLCSSTLQASHGILHRRVVRLLVKLSGASHELPSSIMVQGVALHDHQPLFGGGFADIYRGSYSKTDVAIKRLRVFERGKERERIHKDLCQEALTWRQLQHPFVLPFLGIDSETFPPFLCMISPWMVNGTISKHPALESGQVDILRAILEIAQGLEYVHAENVVHGDLRGGNILLDDEFHVRLADFGLSSYSDATAATHTSNGKGSIRWMAPELHDPESFGMERSRPTRATDVYSFACVCIELHTGSHPFLDISSDTTVLLKVMQGERPLRPSADNGKTMSDKLWALVEQSWVQQHSERPSMPEIVKLMKEWNAE